MLCKIRNITTLKLLLNKIASKLFLFIVTKLLFSMHPAFANGKHANFCSHINSTQAFRVHTSSATRRYGRYLPLPKFHSQFTGSWYGTLEIPSRRIQSACKHTLLICWNMPSEGEEGLLALQGTVRISLGITSFLC